MFADPPSKDAYAWGRTQSNRERKMARNLLTHRFFVASLLVAVLAGGIQARVVSI